MIYIEKQTDKIGGIYIIVNIIDKEAYVGKSNNLTNRTHKNELELGIDNENLQRAYNEGAELIYFKLANEDCEESDDKMLLDYEKLYIHIVEEYGLFKLYNDDNQPKKENRTLEAILKLNSFSSDKSIIEEAKKEFDNDFIARFGLTMKQLSKIDVNERKKALNRYIENKEKFGKTVFRFNKEKMMSNFKMSSYSIYDLNFDDIIISSVGGYIGDTIDDIIKYENVAIDKCGYCLWTYAKNKINIQFGRDFCDRLAKTGKEAFVLFRYTPSDTKSSNEQKTEFPFVDSNYYLSLTEEEKNFLNIKSDNNGKYFVDECIDVTGTKTASRAFVISEFGVLQENFELEEFLELYNCVIKNKTVNSVYDNSIKGYLKNAKDVIKGQHDTSCLQIKRGKSIDSLRVIKSDKTDYFIGKLVAPYIVELQQ